MTDVTDTTVAGIATLAAEVAQNHEALKSAVEAERTAEAAVLERAIEAVRPALRALSSRIAREYYRTGGRNGCNPVSRDEFFDERGVVLVDNYTKSRDETGNRGDLGGEQLWLLTDGTLAIVSRIGTFSHWQGEADHYTASISLLSPCVAMDTYDLADCLTALTTALRKQADGASKARAAKAVERAERLTALVALTR